MRYVRLICHCEAPQAPKQSPGTTRLRNRGDCRASSFASPRTMARNDMIERRPRRRGMPRFGTGRGQSPCPMSLGSEGEACLAPTLPALALLHGSPIGAIAAPRPSLRQGRWLAMTPGMTRWVALRFTHPTVSQPAGDRAPALCLLGPRARHASPLGEPDALYLPHLSHALRDAEAEQKEEYAVQEAQGYQG